MLLMDDDDSGWALMPVNFTLWVLHTLTHLDRHTGVTFLNEADGKRDNEIRLRHFLPLFQEYPL